MVFLEGEKKNGFVCCFYLWCVGMFFVCSYLAEQRDIGGGKEVAGETVRPKQDHIASVVAKGN